jgi:hypothetical protein
LTISLKVVSRTITIDGKVLAIDDIAGITGELFEQMDFAYFPP